ncbi:dopamine receptor 1-like [Littorina saxatilis]|uniref:G-protein coupled receptors family 1 profile domain-containing protein n=1 Tax=Littorina saxatilis TaxID=31220 RepID=A0AAN9G5H6_9CAEN
MAAIFAQHHRTNTTLGKNLTHSPFIGAGEFNPTKIRVVGTILSVIVIASVLGNLLVCLAVCTDKRLWKKSYLFIVSLAVADLLVSCLVMSFAVYNEMHEHWPFGADFCRIWISSDIMCCTASILHLCLIALDRFLQLRDPLLYFLWMTTPKVVGMILTVWIVSALISFLPTSFGWHEPFKEHNVVSETGMCLFEVNEVYAVTSSAVSFFIPCIVMVVIYAKVFGFARYHVLNMRKTTTVGVSNKNQATFRNMVSYTRRDSKAAVTLGVMMGAFLVCWLPFFVVNVTAPFCRTCVPPTVFRVLIWLGYFNSCLNPIIYSMFNTELRLALRNLVCPWTNVTLEHSVMQVCVVSRITRTSTIGTIGTV